MQTYGLPSNGNTFSVKRAIRVSQPLLNAATSTVCRLAFSISASSLAVYGAGVAVYQRYIQSLPPGTAPECGAPWTFRLRDWPLFEWYEPVIRGFGDCAVPDYLLGVPLPIWSALYFCFVLLLVWFGWFKARAVG